MTGCHVYFFGYNLHFVLFDFFVFTLFYRMRIQRDLTPASFTIQVVNVTILIAHTYIYVDITFLEIVNLETAACEIMTLIHNKSEVD